MLWSLKMSQFGTRTFIARGGAFASWGATGAPGWFQNSGEFAIQMCIFLPMSLHLAFGLKDKLPRWRFYGLLALLPGTAFISLIASSSRGGQLGAVAVILFIIAQSKHRVRGLASAALVMGLLWVIMPPQQKERFQEMGEDKNSVARLTYWKDGIKIMNEYPTLGIGYKNWLPYYHRFYNPTGELPHNIFVEAGSELGYTGLLTFVALILATFVVNRRTRKLARGVPEWGTFLRSAAFGLDAALVGFMATGFFVTVLYYPFFWVNLAFTAATFETTRRLANRARVQRHKERRRAVIRAQRPRVEIPAAEVARLRDGGIGWAAP
jgi:O-antigen ligase